MPAAVKAPHQSFWLWVMCLTGVDYFSTLGYQPSIAFDAVGMLAPLATVLLVAVTLGGALPIYAYVARESPHGHGSISMLEHLVRGWTGKFLVLVLLGFAATDFVITKTLSAADAAEHVIHNPLWEKMPPWAHSQLLVTMFLLVLLGAMFLRGFREVITLAVGIVAVYLTLNAVILLAGFWHLATHRQLVADWLSRLGSGEWHLHNVPLRGADFATIALVCLFFFPKLALGLSGFETGVAVMPLVKGNPDDDPKQPAGRIRGTRKLLLTAAAIMSLFLLGSAMLTCTLIPPAALRTDGMAANRALAYLAHNEGPHRICPFFGEAFGTLYDISTVAILWFAGASAMSGLLNLVPRYLPRYGMAPRWAGAIRPLVVLFTVVNLVVTQLFKADVQAQGAAYATGVLVLMTSAAVAVVIDRWRKSKRFFLLRIPWFYLFVLCVFVYITAATVIVKVDGIKIAAAFVAAVILFSMISRLLRSTELRFEGFEFTDETSRVLWDTLRYLEFPILVPHRPGRRPIPEKEDEIRMIHRLEKDVPIVFIEAGLGDPSEFTGKPLIEVIQEQGRFVIRVTRCVSIPHAVATIALELSKTGHPPEIHFGWSDENPLAANLNFLLFGEGNVPWLVREVIQKFEKDPDRRPRVVIG
ncbi:MAG: amino acid transporter [Planctomycetia bacterium]|nr:amino acid transporter [Planctomycetia bacterium]